MWALIGYQFTGGQRDFTSVTQVVATQYEVLVEHRHVQRARELLTEMDPMAAAQAEVRAAREADAAAAAAAAQRAQTTAPSASPAGEMPQPPTSPQPSSSQQPPQQPPADV
jgi:hypothetical protein